MNFIRDEVHSLTPPIETDVTLFCLPSPFQLKAIATYNLLNVNLFLFLKLCETLSPWQQGVGNKISFKTDDDQESNFLPGTNNTL